MRNSLSRSACALLTFLGSGAVVAQTMPAAVAPNRFPLRFEVNQGQTNDRVHFVARGAGNFLLLTPTEAIVVVPRTPPSQASSGPAHVDPRRKNPSASHDDRPPRSIPSISLRVRLAGSNPARELVGIDELPGRSNYFVGRDPAKWVRDVPAFARVVSRDVYPGVDLLYHGDPLESDFVLAPRVDPDVIRLDVSEVALRGPEEPAVVAGTRLRIDERGGLVIRTTRGDVRFPKPQARELGSTFERSLPREARPGRPIEVSFVLRGKTLVGFRVGLHDATKPLLIDPVFASDSGGLTAWGAEGVAADSVGNAYVAGSTYQADMKGSLFGLGFVIGLSRDLTTLRYVSYLRDAFCSAVAVDSNGSAFVAGRADPDGFPVTTGAFQTSVPGSGPGPHVAFFVAKLSGAGQVLYATLLRGDLAGLDPSNIGGIAVDSSGSVFVSGSTFDQAFPTTPGGFQTGCRFGPCAFVARLSPAGTSLLYSAALQSTYGDGVAVDDSGGAYLTGCTLSPGFPTTPGAFQTTFPGGLTAFVTKFSADGGSLVYSTLLGGGHGDCGWGVAVDGAGSAYATGTAGPGFPVTPGAWGASSALSSGAFVTKLAPGGDALVYSAVLRGSPAASSDRTDGVAIAVDSAGSAVVVGATSALHFPTTPDAVLRRKIASHGPNAFVSRFSSDGASLQYSSYLGGSYSDRAESVALGPFCSTYASGLTFSTDFPTTAQTLRAVLGLGPLDPAPAEFLVMLTSLLWPSVGALHFGPVPVAPPASSSSSVNLTNGGGAPAVIASVAITGPNSSDFSQANNCIDWLAPGATPLAPGRSCTIGVTFKPLAAGLRRADLVITVDGCRQTIPLDGIGSTGIVECIGGPANCRVPGPIGETRIVLDCGPEPCTVIVPIKDYCLTAPNGRCPVCPGTPRGPSPVADCPYSMTFEGLENAWTVSLSDTDGRPVAFDRVDTETATVVRVRPDAAHLVDSRPANYIIRFDARPSMKPNAKYEVKTEIRLDPKPPGPGPAER